MTHATKDRLPGTRAFSHLLVPVDGSELSARAIAPALALARVLAARIELVYVHPPAWAPYSGVPAMDSRLGDDQLVAMRHALDTMTARLSEEANYPVTSTTLRGNVVDAITAYVEATGVQLVVMSTRGHSGMIRWRLGSNTDALIRRLTIPVLVVPPRDDKTHPSEAVASRHVQRVLIPIASEEQADDIVGQTRLLDPDGTARYTLLMVVAPHQPIEPFPGIAAFVDRGAAQKDVHEAQSIDLAAARHDLERVAAPLRRIGLDVQTTAIMHRDPADAILQFAHKESVDIIALATHARGLLERIMLGSVANAVLQRSPVPVLVLRIP